MAAEVLEVLFSAEEIAAGVKRLGEAIARDYEGQDPLFVGVLKGAAVFLADLIRAVPIPVRYDFIAVTSYGAATRSSGQVKILKDLDYGLEDEAVILVEDIVDTGLTLNYLLTSFRARRPRSLRVCTLLDKPSRRLVELKPDYNAFVIPDHFVVGYGLDYAEKYRNLPYIAVLRKAGEAGGSREA